MQGQLVLLKHVLQAVPIYHLMAMTLNKGGFDDLEQLCREFIWSLGEQGKPKNALVAWSVISQPHLDGGLGVMPFQKHAQLLKLHCVS